MKKFDLTKHIEFCEYIFWSIRVLSSETTKKGEIWFPLIRLRDLSAAVFESNSIFPLSSQSAKSLSKDINEFLNTFNVTDSEGIFEFSRLNDELNSWQYSHIKSYIENFLLVLREESKDSLIFSLEPTGIYDFRRLHDNASLRFHDSTRSFIPEATIEEYKEAGKCFAFGLYTACGFHALRTIEIMIKNYIESYGKPTSKLKTWSQFVKAMEDLDKEKISDGEKMSPKISSMIDRIREIERNPLMHPEDVLNLDSADTLFSLSWIVISEMAKDIKERQKAN